MTLWVLPFLFFHSSTGAEEPFWRAKAKLYHRVTEQNEIIVSVTSQKLEDHGKKFRMNMAGGGVTAVPIDYAFAKAMDFPSLPRISEYIQAAQYDPKSKKLHLKMKAYGHEIDLKMNIATREAAERKFIDFTVESGALQGLKGTVDLRSLKPKSTETGYAASFDYDVLPIPKLFIEFGAEVVLKRVAFRMRQTIERDYRHE